MSINHKMQIMVKHFLFLKFEVLIKSCEVQTKLEMHRTSQLKL